MKPRGVYRFTTLQSVITCTMFSCALDVSIAQRPSGFRACVCVTQYCELVLLKQQEHPCTGMIKHNQPTDLNISTSRGHGARFLSRANEAIEIGWMRCWTQHLVPAAVHLDA